MVHIFTSSCGYKLCLFAIIVVFLKNLEVGTDAAAVRGECPNVPKPLNRSIKACWDNTNDIKTSFMKRNNGLKTEICVPRRDDISEKERGLEIVKTASHLYCATRKSYFSESEISKLNIMILSLNEIIRNPKICATATAHFPPTDCSVYSVVDNQDIFKALVEQIQLLEALYLDTLDFFL